MNPTPSVERLRLGTCLGTCLVAPLAGLAVFILFVLSVIIEVMPARPFQAKSLSFLGNFALFPRSAFHGCTDDIVAYCCH